MSMTRRVYRNGKLVDNPDAELKHCPKCVEDKPVTCFSSHSKAPDALQAHCKDCDKEYQKAYRAKMKTRQALKRND